MRVSSFWFVVVSALTLLGPTASFAVGEDELKENRPEATECGSTVNQSAAHTPGRTTGGGDVDRVQSTTNVSNRGGFEESAGSGRGFDGGGSSGGRNGDF